MVTVLTAHDAGWQPLSVVDGNRITVQNSASSIQTLVNLLAAEKAA